MKIRTFIAIDIPEDIKNKIFEVERKLMQTGANAKWENKEKFHITLKFLGDVEENMIDKIHKTLENALSEFNQFEVQYEGVGCFPGLSKPRVIWVGCKDETGKLNSLRNIVEDEMVKLGFKPEDKEFNAHVTLGRVKKGGALENLIKMLKNINFPPVKGKVTEVLVMKSDLKPTGSVYTVLKKIKLKE